MVIPPKADFVTAIAKLRPKPPTLFLTLAYNVAQGGSAPTPATHQLGLHGVEHRASARQPLHGGLSALRLTADLRRLDGTVHARLFGKNFYRLKFERRLFWVGVREGGNVNPHFHMAWWVPGPLVRNFALLFGQSRREDVWRDQTGSGASHVRIIDGGLDWAHYLLKANPHLAAGDESLFVASQFWPADCRPAEAVAN
jgi:hypothetical protein